VSAIRGLRRYAVNATAMLVAEVAGKLASFVFVVVVARSLGPREFGYFNFAISFVPLFLILGTLALDSILIRELARDRDRLSELWASGLLLRLSFGALGLGLAFALAPLFVHGGRAYVALLIVGSALFLDELSYLVGTVFKAFERMELYASIVLVNRLLSTALSVVAAALGAGLVTICLTYLAGSAGALLFGTAALTRVAPVDVRAARRRTVSQLLRFVAPLGVAGVLNTAVYRVDTVMLQAFKGAVQVGIYGVAYRFLDSFLFVAWALTNVALPRMARASRTAETTRTYELTLALMLCFYLPLAAVTPFSARWIVTTIFSSRYGPAADAVPALTAAACLYGLAYLGRVAAIALGRRALIAAIAAVALAANVGLNAFAIPRWGFKGAAWVTLATEVVEGALLTIVFVRTHERPRLARPLLVPVAATLALVAVVAGAGLRDGRALLVGVLVYLPALALATRLLYPEAVRRLRLRGDAVAFAAPEGEP
jgi:O-antigen/teichoic acid export membrane protein